MAIRLIEKKSNQTNDLTNNIIKFVNMNHGFAIRTNTSGIPLIVNGRIVGWRKSKSRGCSDIDITYKGLAIKVEIKQKDKLSFDQQVYKQNVLNAGGSYWEIRSMDEFLEKWNNFLEK